MASTTVSALASTDAEDFTLTLDNFEGPFDLLLSLITRRKLDITEVALARVTDEFIAYMDALYERGTADALDRASDFLVTAATLLDLKTARLLPRGEAKAEEDIALLEARDLLFARLLQYRAYRDVAAVFERRYRAEAKRFPRRVALEPQFKSVLPELVFSASPAEFARIAAAALSASRLEDERETAGSVNLEHLRPPATSISTEESVIMRRLGQKPELSFSDLLSGAGEFEVAVVRFLALLELFRRGVVLVNQREPLGEISVSALSPSAEGEV